MRALRHANDLDAAVQAYQMWHQKEVDRAVEVDYPLESARVFRAGYGEAILYVSDKWEEDGRVWDYSHDFDSRPAVYTTDGDGAEADPEALLGGVRVAANARATMPILAGVKELELIRDDGTKRILRFGRTPMMLCTVDKKGLVILTSQMGPIYIRGGRMVVTERGIHH